MTVGGMERHMFTNATIGTLSGGTFIVNHTQEKSVLKTLSTATAHSALHNAPARTDGTRCLQDTRTNILDHLERWAQGICDEGAPIMWLHGGAGAGKSAIMQTLAERFVAEGLALGSFFFWRGDSTRNTVDAFIPTLAYQLSQLFPSALEILDPIIDRDPLIFNKNLQVQLLDLLVRPLEHLVQLGSISDAPQSSRVFLIDGLDECSDPVQQQAIIQAAAAVCHKHRIPVKFLIASRPEIQISASFQSYMEENFILAAIPLSEDTDADRDIRRFIENEFSNIRSHHPFKKIIPSEWPDFYDITRLVWKSSSHFIYASTAMKYIWSAKESPVRSLRVVLGLEASRTTAPFADLNALYHHILQSSAHLDKVLQIIAHRLCSPIHQRYSLTSVVLYMLDCSEDDLFIYLADVSPLVVISKLREHNRFDKLKVTLLHASLEDFLCDQSRSGSLYIDKEVYLVSELERCFQLADIGCQARTLQDCAPSIWDQDAPSLINFLYSQIIYTIQITGHLATTQEVLRRYSLLKFFEWRLCLEDSYDEIYDVLVDFFTLFLTIHRITTSQGVTLFKSSADEFLDILDTHISLKKVPLFAAMFRLVCNGYTAHGYWEALEQHLPRNPLIQLYFTHDITFAPIIGRISAAELTSIRQDLNASSESMLAVAVEEILHFMFGDPAEDWLYDKRQFGYSIIDALLWALPQAGPSPIIELYAIKISQTMRKMRSGANPDSVFLRVVDCLDQYDVRIQNTKLAQLEQRIENGDINAVMTKSSTLVINDQD